MSQGAGGQTTGQFHGTGTHHVPSGHPLEETVRNLSEKMFTAVEMGHSREHLYHLVQQEDVIYRLHAEELPPDACYDELALLLAEDFPGADPFLVQHVVALVAAFDTAAAFAVSFGVAKFQLA